MKNDMPQERPVFDSRFKAFKYWLVNVFWYHYRVIVLVVILSAALLIFFVYDYVNVKEPDMVYLVVTNEVLEDSHLEWLNELAAERIGDANGDSESHYAGQAVSLNESLGELAVINGQRLIISMHEPEYCLYIFGAEFNERWDLPEQFVDLSGFGPTAVGKPWALDVSAFMRDYFAFEGDYYAVVEKVSEEMSGKTNIEQSRETALRLIELIMDL